METTKPLNHANDYESRLNELLRQKLSIQLQIDALEQQYGTTELHRDHQQPLTIYFQQFLQQKQSEVQKSTFTFKYHAYRKWVQDILGNSTSLIDFDVNYAREVVDKLKQSTKLSTVRVRVQVIKLFWDWMQPDNDTPINPWRIAMKGLYADDVGIDGTFFDNERSLVLGVIDDNDEYKEWHDLIDFSMQARCTLLQALSLTWNDIDFSRALITFSCCCDRWGYSKPSIKMSKSLKALLEPILLDPLTDIDGNVFTLKTDQTPNEISISITKKWKGICTRAGIPYRRLNSTL